MSAACEVVYRLEGVRKVYAGRLVLNIEALTVRRGEILAVLGPSGAGKSTLLRLLNFLEQPDAGRLYFCGEPLPREGAPLAWRRRVTTVFQQPQLLRASVAANVALGLRYRGVRDGHRRVQAVLEMVGLAPLARQPAEALSGGEAQRVALARAVVLEPEVLLLDEPTANLDPANGALVEGLIRHWNAERGTTMVLVTHNMFQARRLAHRVALLLSGELVEVAPTQAFFEAPRDPRTAAFVRGELLF